jgi:hypothetical protein
MVGDSYFDPKKFEIQQKNLPWAKSTKLNKATGRTVIDPRAQKMATRTFKATQILALEGLIKRAGTKQALNTMHFPSGKGILKQLDNFGDEAANNLWGPKMTEGIKNYARLLQELQVEKSAMAGAIGLKLVQFGQAISLVTTTIIGGPFSLMPVSILGFPYLLSSALANPASAGLLKKGMLAPLTQKGTSQATAAFARLGKILVESQKESARFVKDSLYADMNIPDEDLIHTEVPIHQPPNIQMPIPGTGPASPAITPPRGDVQEGKNRNIEDFLRQREIQQQERFPRY